MAAVEANHKFHVALRNQINYNKSWCWATTKDGRACWHAYLLTLPGHRRFPVRNTGVDLGAQMSYTKQNAAVAKNRRIDEAIRRANAIPTLPLCVSDAAKAIRTAVLSVGLFGVEGNVPAHDKLHELRLAIAYALTGFDTRKKGQHSGNACSTLTDFIVDPTFECCKLVFKNIAYWAKKDRALALTAWDLACCYQRASDAHQPMRRLNGPGQALWTVCQVLGWKLLPDLTLTDTRGISYKIAFLSSSEIVDILIAAWPDVVLAQLLKRKTFQNLDSFHPSRTGIALRKCHKGHRKTLTGLLLGTHSSVEQRKHWQSASQLLCPLCKLGEDTVMHTVIHCPELVNEREKWAGMLQGLPLDDELLFCFPSVPATQWDDEIAMILWDLSLPQPSFGAGCIGERFCYTDGSCDVLHDCSHPVAAWSIVLDAAATMQERALLGQLALSDVQSVASRFSVLPLLGNVTLVLVPEALGSIPFLSYFGLRHNSGRLSDNCKKKKFKWWVGGYGLLPCALCIRLKQTHPVALPPVSTNVVEPIPVPEAPGLQSKPHSIVRKSIALSDVMLTVFVRTRVCCHLLHVGVSTVRSAKGEIKMNSSACLLGNPGKRQYSWGERHRGGQKNPQENGNGQRPGYMHKVD